MNRPTLFSVLRIAVTVLSLTACVLLIALWVRSYWWHEGINQQYSRSRILHASSYQGVLRISTGKMLPPNLVSYTRFHRESVDIWLVRSNGFGPKLVPKLSATPQGIQATLPYWLTALVMGMFTVAPWLNSRFSLRTLLIATTLVAVVLGLVMLSS